MRSPLASLLTLFVPATNASSRVVCSLPLLSLLLLSALPISALPCAEDLGAPTVTVGTNCEITFDWNTNSGLIVGFDVRYTNSGGQDVALCGGIYTDCTVDRYQINASGRVAFYVRAYCSGGGYHDSPATFFDLPPPSTPGIQPTSLTVTNGVPPATVSLTWTHMTGNANVRLYRDNETTPFAERSSSPNTYSFTETVCGAITYKVSGVSPQGCESAKRSASSFTPPPPPPPPAANPVTTVAGSQQAPIIISDGAYGSYVAWVDYGGASPAVRVQHLGRKGTAFPGWPTNGVLVTTTSGSQTQPVLVQSTQSVIVAWTDQRGSTKDIYAQRFLSNNPVPRQWGDAGRAVCTAAGDQENPGIASRVGGGCYLAWSDTRNDLATASHDIYVQKLIDTGSPQWASNGEPVSTAAGDQVRARIVERASGGQPGVVVSFEDRRYPPRVKFNYVDDQGTHGSRLLGDGVLVSNMDTAEADDQAFADVFATTDPNVAIVVYERHAPDNYEWDIWAQKVTSSGSLLWGSLSKYIVNSPETQSNNWLSGPYAMIDNANSRIIATWQDARNSPPTFAIYAGAIDLNGNALWTAQQSQVSNIASVNAWYPKVRSDAAGGAIICWQQTDPQCAAGWQIAIKRIAASGDAPWPITFLDLAPSVSPILPSLGSDGSGGVFAAWQRGAAGSEDIYEQRVTNGGVVAPTIPPPAAASDLVVTACDMTSITLGWTAPADGVGLPLVSYEIHYSQNPITEQNWDGATFYGTKTAGAPGTLETYALGSLLSCRTYYIGIKSVDMDGTMSSVATVGSGTTCSPYQVCADGRPQGPGVDGAGRLVSDELALRLSPSPATSQLVFEYDVPAKHGQIEMGVFDIAGRRVHKFDGLAAATGRNRAEWDLRDSAGRRVRAGLYWVRLTTEGRKVTRCIVVQ
jgi:hypothetical protein